MRRPNGATFCSFLYKTIENYLLLSDYVFQTGFSFQFCVPLSDQYYFIYSFLVSSLYSKAKLAAACAGIIYFLTYVPYMYIAVREEAAHDHIPAWLKSLAVRVLLL